jgi:hypothetical protein
MADLRTEIRAAFDKEQSVFPPPPAMRHEVVDAVAARQKAGSVAGRGQANLQWVAVAAAILITVAIVAGLMSVRLTQRQVPGRPSPATSTPTPKDYGPPPAGVALLYVVDPNHPGWLIGFDWTGRPRGTVKLAQPVDPLNGFSQSPDGSAFAYGFYGKGANLKFLDRLGQPIGGISQTQGWVMWADDARHICTLDGANGQWNLGLLLPGEAAAKTSVVAMDSNNLRSGIFALSFAGCSARNDQAVVAYSYAGRSSEYWVFRISDGKTLAHRTFATDQEVNFVASPDGTLIAENSAKSTGQVAPAAPSTIVRRISDMSSVATLDPSVAVVGFNSDGSLALLATTPWASGLATHLQVIDPRTGAAVWRYDATEQLSSLLVQPGGHDFAVLLQDPRDSTSPPSVDVVIVHGDGTSTQIPGRYINLQ